MEDSELRQRLDQLEKMMLEIKNHLGIGTVRPADVIDIRRKAKEKAAHLGNQKTPREPIPDRH